MTVNSLICNTCHDSQCLHAQAAQLAIDDQLCLEVEARSENTLNIFFLTDHSVVIMANAFIHTFNCKVCELFSGTCSFLITHVFYLIGRKLVLHNLHQAL